MVADIFCREDLNTLHHAEHVMNDPGQKHVKIALPRQLFRKDTAYSLISRPECNIHGQKNRNA